MRGNRTPRGGAWPTSATHRRSYPIEILLFAVVLPTFLVVAPPVFAQFPQPFLTSMTPAGGRPGDTVEVVLKGKDLDDIQELHFSTPHLRAERVPDPPPPKDTKKKAPPPELRFRIAVAPQAPLGTHDVRVVAKWGISNPRAFVVGPLETVLEKENNDDVPEAQKVPLDCVVDGTIAAKTDVDYYAIAGAAGQRVVVHCAASSVDSRLTPLLQVFSSDGRELGLSRQYLGRDALVDFRFPDDQPCFIRLCHFAYLDGGDDNFYRLAVTRGPWLDAAFPPVLQAGRATPVTFFGRNLPGGLKGDGYRIQGRPLEKALVTVKTPADPDENDYRGMLSPRVGLASLFGFRMKGETGVSNPFPLAVTEAPVLLEDSGNDSRDQAQKLTVPCELCGRFEKIGDADWYAFEAKKGEPIHIEIWGDRLRAPMDLHYRLYDAEGKTLGQEQDDDPALPDRVANLWTYSDDPAGRFVPPADGTYYLRVRSRLADFQAGPRRIYRLAMRRPQPDFRLLAFGNDNIGGGGFTLHKGGCLELGVFCYRRDGFDGEIQLAVEGLPPGVSCPPQTIGPNQKEAYLVLQAAGNAPAQHSEIRIKGTAILDGKPRTRLARPAAYVWPIAQKNVPAVSRLARSISLAVRDQGPYVLEPADKEIALPVGGKRDLKVRLKRQWAQFKEQVQVTRLSAPVLTNGQFMNVGNFNIAKNQSEGTAKISVPTNVVPGTYNLVLQGNGKFQYQENPKAKKVNLTYYTPTYPVRFVVYDQVAELALADPKISLQPGGETAVVVRLKRLHDYKGEFQIDLDPPGGSGIAKTSVKVPAGANEARLVLKADKKAKLGSNPNFVVRATAKVDNVTLKQDLKFTVTVSAQVSASGEAVEFRRVPLVDAGAPGWKFAAANGVKGTAYRNLDFDDAAWKPFEAPLGYGEDEVAGRKGTSLPLEGQPVLVRRVLDVPAELLSTKRVLLGLSVASDNSATIFLNGKAVDEDASDHEFAYWNREVQVPAALLRPGRNVLAAEVHNTSGSSDCFFDLELIAQVPMTAKK